MSVDVKLYSGGGSDVLRRACRRGRRPLTQLRRNVVAVRPALAGPAMLHVATHGFCCWCRPRRCDDQGPRHARPVAYLLRGHMDIGYCRRRPTICPTGSTRRRACGGALVLAGAASQVISLWSVLTHRRPP